MGVRDMGIVNLRIWGLGNRLRKIKEGIKE